MREVFLWDVDDPATADAAVARLTRQAAGVFTDPVDVCAWRENSSTYLVCTRDRAIPEDVQRACRPRAARRPTSRQGTSAPHGARPAGRRALSLRGMNRTRAGLGAAFLLAGSLHPRFPRPDLAMIAWAWQTAAR